MASFKTRLNELFQTKIGLETVRFALDFELDKIKEECQNDDNPHIVVFELNIDQ